MKQILLFFFVLAYTRPFAQPGISGLVGAERAFAADALAHGTRDAFLHFLDSSGVVFQKGEMVNGIEAWTKREKKPGILAWRPQFAEVSSSGDFGYTTGPWTFQPHTTKDSVVARGQYNTVWQMDSAGRWKFLVDIGTSYPDTNTSGHVQKALAGSRPRKADLRTVQSAEAAFQKAFSVDRNGAYKEAISSRQCFLNRNGHLPARGKKEQEAMIAETPKDLFWVVKGARMAPSGDLACIYGTTKAGMKEEGYLHIWRREGLAWKLALEVLQY